LNVDPEAPEIAYYQTIEEFFVSRRGDPLFISSADWILIRRWRRAGVPLRVVLRGIEDALDAHRHSWGRERRAGSLAYCAKEVDAARERWHRALALGQEEGLDVAAHVRRLCESLDGATPIGPEGKALARRIAEELRPCVEGGPPPKELEARLASYEKELIEVLLKETPVASKEEMEEAVDRELAPYRERMPGTVLEQIRRDSFLRRLLHEHGLVRLSLFLS